MMDHSERQTDRQTESQRESVGDEGEESEGMRRGIDEELKDEYCCPTGDGERSGRRRGGVRRDEEAKERDMVQYRCPAGPLRLALNAAHMHRERDGPTERRRERHTDRDEEICR